MDGLAEDFQVLDAFNRWLLRELVAAWLETEPNNPALCQLQRVVGRRRALPAAVRSANHDTARLALMVEQIAALRVETRQLNEKAARIKTETRATRRKTPRPLSAAAR